MKEKITLTNGKTVSLKEPDMKELNSLSDHDLLIVLHTQMISVRDEVSDMKKSFASKWVENITITFIVLAVGGVVTLGFNLIGNALSANAAQVRGVK